MLYRNKSCPLNDLQVLQQGRKHAITIKKTKTKGWGAVETSASILISFLTPVSSGVFAKETIPAGSYIGVYTGELLTEGFAGKRAR